MQNEEHIQNEEEEMEKGPNVLKGILIGLAGAVFAVAVLAAVLWIGGASMSDVTALVSRGAPNAGQQGKPQFGRMELQAQYAGPFEDTLIQRWRDPLDGRICYLYVPVQVKRGRSRDNAFVDYGANTIGSISCGIPGAGSAPASRSEAPKAE